MFVHEMSNIRKYLYLMASNNRYLVANQRLHQQKQQFGGEHISSDTERDIFVEEANKYKL